MIENDLDGLADGKLGCSANDGRATMKEVQKFTIERQLDRYSAMGPRSRRPISGSSNW